MRTKSEERRLAILQTAATVFNEVGFAAASMNEIAARVGGSKTTLYSYYPSKRELFVAMMEQGASERFASVFEQLDPQQPLAQVLQQFGLHYLEVILSDDVVGIDRMAKHEARISEVGQLVYENGINVGWRKVSDYLQACAARGVIRDTEVAHAAWQLKALLEAEVRDKRLFGIWNYEQAMAQAPGVVSRAVAVWLAAYGPALKPARKSRSG